RIIPSRNYAAHSRHIFHVEIAKLKIKPREHVAGKQRGDSHRHPPPSRSFAPEKRKEHLGNGRLKLIAYPAFFSRLGANQIPGSRIIQLRRPLLRHSPRRSKSRRVCGRATGNKKAAVAYATAALPVQSGLDFVRERELELVGALLHAGQERIGVATAPSEEPCRVHPEQDVARVAIHVG